MTKNSDLYLDFYLSTSYPGLLVGAIAIHDALYCYRMHGKNKHSDGLVLGGTSQTSRKNFGPISRRVMELILTVMLERKSEIIELLDSDRLRPGCAGSTSGHFCMKVRRH